MQLDLFATNSMNPQMPAPGSINPSATDAIMMAQKSPIRYILDQQFIRVRQDILKLRWAVDAAENVAKYDRQLLHNTYREIIRDPHVHAQWESRKMKVKEKAFKIQDISSGEEDKLQTKILEKQWFYDWIDACLDEELWGFTMMEFGPWENDQFQPYRVQTTYAIKWYPPVNVLVRDYIKPELGIVTQIPNANTGISFDDPNYSDNLMFVGRPYNFGLLFKMAKFVLFKENGIGNWSEWAEVFGMDTRVGKTTAQGEDRRNFIKAIQNFGANQYMVVNPQFEETIEFAGTSKQDAYKVYHELCKYIDEQISKVIWGQDVVSNNTGRVVGTTGENIANMYGAADAKKIEILVNERLLPFIEQRGYKGFVGKEFRWDNTEKISMDKRAIIDKSIVEMGFKIDPNYIKTTYNVPVEEKIESDNDIMPITKVKEKVKALYE